MTLENSSAQKSEIVVYQPDSTMRLEVRIIDESVWLNQMQLCELFGVAKSSISYHLRNIFETEELERERTVRKIRTVQIEGGRSVARQTEYFNLEVIISLGFRINSRLGIQFRRWANGILKSYMTNGVAVINPQIVALANEIDRRLASHNKRIVDLEERVDYFVKTNLPPKEKVLCEGRMLDAQFELTRIVKMARKRIVLIDNYIDERTLMLLGNRRAKVECTVYTQSPNSPKLTPALANYARQYPALPITLKGYKKSHDRFLIIDNTVWHIGASLKDAGSALFALMRMELDPKIILSILD